MDVSIVIVSWKVRELLRECLTSLFSYTQGLSCEVIVVDNNSQDGTVEMIYAEFPQVNLIINSANEGFSKANNQGLALAQGEYVLFMNPDMKYTENTIGILHSYMKQHPNVAVVTGGLVYGDGSRQPNIKRDPALCDQMIVALKLHHFVKPACLKRYLATDFDYSKEQSVEQVMGAFMFCRGSVIRERGGWDSDYWVWWEDLQLCTDIRKTGGIIMYVPNTQVIHYEGKAFEQQPSLQKQKRFMRGMRLYFKKNKPLWQWLVISLCSPISLLLAWGVQLLKFRPRTQSKL